MLFCLRFHVILSLTNMHVFDFNKKLSTNGTNGGEVLLKVWDVSKLLCLVRPLPLHMFVR